MKVLILLLRKKVLRVVGNVAITAFKHWDNILSIIFPSICISLGFCYEG